MSSILYEHPLNERIRNYLKLEQLLSQVHDCYSCNIELSHQIFFSAFFAIIDTLERNDIRGDLIKDLEKLEQNLVLWSRSPDVDDHALEENIQKAVAFLSQLKCPSPQWLQLKEDKFLSTLKQRYAMQGGNASFDLPQLKFWLNQPLNGIKQQTEQWVKKLDHITGALELVLKFLRQRSEFKAIQAVNGFYQDNAENLVLLRMKLPQNADCYPTVSGNRFRYSIRFMTPCEQTGKMYYDNDFTFQLARC